MEETKGKAVLPMDKNVALPFFLREEIKPLKNPFPQKRKVMVFDTETEEGLPYLLTFYDGDKITYFKVDEKTIALRFMHYLLEHCSKHEANILFAHNLQFDLTAILCERETEIFKFRRPQPVPVYDGKLLGEIKIFCETQWFAQIRLSNRANIKVVDSANFFRASLYELSRILGFKYKKRERPYFVEEGRAPRNREEWQHLYLYCNSEIKAEFELAQYILGLHKKYDVGYCVSMAQLSGRIFKKRFLPEPIAQINPFVRKIAEYTIHGGRANTFVKTPIVIPNVKMYDYNSFYPFAMTKLPAITKGEWLRVDFKSEQQLRESLDSYEGFFQVSGYVEKCKYPIILKKPSSLDYANGEKISDVCVSSYELREALRNDEIRIEFDKLEGYVWKPDRDAKNPFKDYVEHFYSLKNSTEKDSPLYLAYKLILNSLYGKTYQTIRQRNDVEKPELVWNENFQKCFPNKVFYRAGGLYLPHVGSWITALCRAKLHEDLHRHEAIDCATDSFKTVHTVPEGKELGDLKLVCEGLLLLMRPKVYVMFSGEIQKEVIQKGDLREWLKTINLRGLESPKDIVHNARHGFGGNVFDLLEVYRDNKNGYVIKHMTKIGEAIRQRKQARVMEIQKRTLKIKWEEEEGLHCGLPKAEALRRFELCNNQCFLCAYVT